MPQVLVRKEDTNKNIADREARILTIPSYRRKVAKLFLLKYRDRLSYHAIARRTKLNDWEVYYAIQAFAYHAAELKDTRPIATELFTIENRISELYKELKKAKKSTINKYTKDGELIESKKDFHSYTSIIDQIRKYEELHAEISGVRSRANQPSQQINYSFRDLILISQKKNADRKRKRIEIELDDIPADDIPADANQKQNQEENQEEILNNAE